jgi:hypothetical protein
LIRIIHPTIIGEDAKSVRTFRSIAWDRSALMKYFAANTVPPVSLEMAISRFCLHGLDQADKAEWKLSPNNQHRFDKLQNSHGDIKASYHYNTLNSFYFCHCP